jgi:hypothetical protein
LSKIPNIEETLKKELGIAEPEGDGRSFLELLHLPTLNINGSKAQMLANLVQT